MTVTAHVPIPPPPGTKPTVLSALGQQLIQLGQAMQNPDTQLGDLTRLAKACGLDDLHVKSVESTE